MTDQLSWLGFEEATISPVAAASRLLAALICGGLIGFDREIHDRPAGLRTHMMVALAAALFTMLAFEIFADTEARAETTRSADPLRILEAVASGVALLAAGAVIVLRGNVEGLTTGASLWLAGAAGLAVGLGLYWLGYLATIAALGVLVFMQLAKIGAARLRDEVRDGLHHARPSRGADRSDASTAAGEKGGST